MPNKILAIDDSLALRTFISKTLAQNTSEFNAVTAKDGTEGLALAEAGDADVILLDFILPDMGGEDVCKKLATNPRTANIPVVMMSSNVADIKRLEGIYPNIVKALAKPFTQDLLMQSLRYVIRSQDEKAGRNSQTPEPAAPTPKEVAVSAKEKRKIVFAGRSDFFPLYRAFASAQHADLTGILWLYIDEYPLECYFHCGWPVMITTKDYEMYLRNSPFKFTPAQAAKLDEAGERQKKTGLPVFVQLLEMGLFDECQLATVCHDHGFRLLAQAWTAGCFEFEFEEVKNLPEVTTKIHLVASSIDEWMLESLRYVGDETLSAIAWGDISGIPIYTRDGYERIQQISVNDEEAKFLSHVGDTALSDVCQRSGIPIEQAQRILYRFLCLNIFEYWPTAIFRGDT